MTPENAGQASGQACVFTPENCGGAMIPEWIKSQRKARGQCEACGQEPIATTWAGTGEEICWACCDKRQAAYHNERGVR